MNEKHEIITVSCNILKTFLKAKRPSFTSKTRRPRRT